MYIGYSYFLHVSALEGDDSGICKNKKRVYLEIVKICLAHKPSGGF